MKKGLLSLLVAFMAGLISAGAASYKRVSVHDPSIVVAYSENGKVTGEKSETATKMYYIFGSHKAFAKSSDMMNWTTFSNNIQNDQNELFANEIAWSSLGGSNYDVNGNLWAPDVIWNRAMKKWCMYMSVNGDNWYSTIVLLTSDSPEGNWTYVGPVVYSIPWKASESNVKKYTDLYEVLGLDSSASMPSRYKENRNGNQTYGMNAIDPCVFYDEEGTLWMVYGSWFGGLYALQLDGETGLRDKTRKYELKGGSATSAQEDPYQGIKVYGGFHVSGEAPYVEYINGKYYLFVTYGGLTAAGGYNMRVFSSDSPTGPYKDLAGHDARYGTSSTINSVACPGTVNGQVGTRLMSYYKWSWMSNGFCAQGHNSAVVDDDGKIFNVYHTRFNTGNEGHEVRVHQMFVARNGGLCCAPFEYCGETLPEKQFDLDEIPGFYSVLVHGTGTDYSNLECVQEKEIELHADGTISGAASGKWEADSDKPYISIKLGSTTYEGVLVEQYAESTNHKVLCLTGVSKSDISLWGFKKYAKGQSFEDSPVNGDDVAFVLGTEGNDSAFFSVFSEDYVMDGDGTLEAEFTNYTAGQNNWENWLLVCTNDKDRNASGYVEYLVQRADYWWWATGKDGGNAGCEANFNWDTFRQDMDKAVVKLKVVRSSDTLDIRYDITTADGKELWYTQKLTTTMDRKIRLFFTNEKSCQVFRYVTLTMGDASIADVLNDKKEGYYYDLMGRKVENPAKGIYIHNGKKVFIK